MRLPSLWIRLDARAPDDPKIALVADALNIPLAHAFGCCAAVWATMADHARDGRLAGLPASAIENWAKWTGTPGSFASAFLSAFPLDADGVLPGWATHQGKLVAFAAHDAERKRQEREALAAAAAAGGPAAASVPETQAAPLPAVVQPRERQRRARRAAAPAHEPEPKTTWITPYAEAWTAAYGGEMAVKKHLQALAKLEDEHGHEEVLRRWKNMLATKRAEFASGPALVQGWGQYTLTAANGGALVAPGEVMAVKLYSLICDHGLATCPPETLRSKITELFERGVVKDCDRLISILRRLDFAALREARVAHFAHKHIMERAGDLLAVSA